MAKIETLTIEIFKSSEGGYMYDIYDCEAGDANDGRDSLDGGHCTSTLENAIEMACDQAKALVKRSRPICAVRGCNIKGHNHSWQK